LDIVIWIINFVFQLLTVLILIRAILSWIRPDPYHPAVRLLRQVTDPILLPIQRVVPPLGGIDISPVVALILIELIRRVVVSVLLRGF
jgi:YggT family protein